MRYCLSKPLPKPPQQFGKPERRGQRQHAVWIPQLKQIFTQEQRQQPAGYYGPFKPKNSLPQSAAVSSPPRKAFKIAVW